MIFIGILIGLILAAVGIWIYQSFTSRDFDPLSFRVEQANAVEQFKEKKRARLKEIEDAADILEKELYKSYETTASILQAKESKMQKEFEAKGLKLKESFRQKEQDLKDSYANEQEFLKRIAADQAVARAEQFEKEIEIEKDRQTIQFQNLNKVFEEKKEKLNLDFLAFSEQISQKKEKIQKEIDDYESKQSLLIARFKQDEEIRQKRNFYKIEIDPLAARDIAKLKDLALNFSKPDAIYKLIWEVYYKTPMEAMFKRVLGENASKGGIYKITNVTNEKVYVGRTTKLIDRWRTHSKRGCGIEMIKGLLYESMLKEGLENFTFEILEVCDKEAQSAREKYWIQFYKSCEYGYNQVKGG